MVELPANNHELVQHGREMARKVSKRDLAAAERVAKEQHDADNELGIVDASPVNIPTPVKRRKPDAPTRNAQQTQ
jgi:hypothetical protein